METLRDVFIGAKDLISNTGWCQGAYALKDGKTFYNYLSSELADGYCLSGAFNKVCQDFWKSNGVLTAEAQVPYNTLAYSAGQFIVKMAGFNGGIADFNDQDEEARQFNEFVNQLRQRCVPREQAKIEINKFKQELKSRHIEPILSKEKVLALLNRAIDLVG